jgi:hypothetical protein
MQGWLNIYVQPVAAPDRHHQVVMLIFWAGDDDEKFLILHAQENSLKMLPGICFAGIEVITYTFGPDPVGILTVCQCAQANPNVQLGRC